MEASTIGKSLATFFAGLSKTGSIKIDNVGGHKFSLGDGSIAKLGRVVN